MKPIIKEQILAVRNTGKANMFDIKNVQHIANCKGFYELVIYLEEHPNEYFDFLLGRDQ